MDNIAALLNFFIAYCKESLHQIIEEVFNIILRFQGVHMVGEIEV